MPIQTFHVDTHRVNNQSALIEVLGVEKEHVLRRLKFRAVVSPTQNATIGYIDLVHRLHYNKQY